MKRLHKFLSWSFTNARDIRKLELRERMIKIHEADSEISKPHAFFCDDFPLIPYKFTRVETIKLETRLALEV